MFLHYGKEQSGIRTRNVGRKNRILCTHSDSSGIYNYNKDDNINNKDESEQEMFQTRIKINHKSEAQQIRC